MNLIGGGCSHALDVSGSWHHFIWFTLKTSKTWSIRANTSERSMHAHSHKPMQQKQPLSLSSVSLSRSHFSFLEEISPHLNPWFRMIYMGMLGIIIAFLFAAWQHTGYNLVLTHTHMRADGNWGRVSANKLYFKQFSLKASLWVQISFISIWSALHFITHITFWACLTVNNWELQFTLGPLSTSACWEWWW